MTDRTLEASPRFKARIAGLFEALEGLTSGLAEIPLQLWLLVKGVNPQRGNEQASAAGASIRT